MSRRPATPNRQAVARSPTPESIRTLNTEALRLHLNRHNLATTGKRQELVERLLQWYAASHRDAERSSQEGGSESGSEPNHTRTVHGSQDNSSSSDEGNDGGQASSSSKEAHSFDEDGQYARGQHPRHHHSYHQREGGLASRHQQHCSHHQREQAHTSSHHSHHQASVIEGLPRGASIASIAIGGHRASSSASLLSNSSDTNSDTSSSLERHHHRYRVKHHRNRRRHSYRHRHSSQDNWVADAVVSCAPPIPRHLRRNLKQGK